MSHRLAPRPPASLRGVFASRKLIVGQAPPKRIVGPHRAFSADTLSGRRLNLLLDRPVWDDFFCVNLIREWVEGEEPEWSLARGRTRADELKAMPSPWLFVLCGRSVQQSFGVSTPEPLGWGRMGRHVALVFPHPNGLSRFWNDAEQVDRASVALRDAARL